MEHSSGVPTPQNQGGETKKRIAYVDLVLYVRHIRFVQVELVPAEKSSQSQVKLRPGNATDRSVIFLKTKV
jgi:hypothetical protein